MQREIKFRGKRLDNGEWVQGYFLVAAGMPFISAFGERSPILVIPETVGQYTGLKDKNSKEIYEGDVMVCRQYIGGNFIDYCIERGFVEMLHGAFGLHRKQGYYRPFKDWLEAYEYEIIGNIHDNPELMEGAEP